MTSDPAVLSSTPLWFVFNELSARVRADTVVEGHERMSGLLTGVATIMNGQAAELICIGENVLWAAELAAGYTVSDWWASADRDHKYLLQRIATKTDFPDDVGAALRDRFYLSEFLPADGGGRDRTDARGLGAAFLLDGIAVSLPSEERWKAIRIRLRHIWLDRRGTERERNVNVLNLAGSSDLERIGDALLENRQHSLVSEPSALSARKAECFPHLAFGRDVDGHLVKIPKAYLGNLIRKLILLDDAVRIWRRTRTMKSPIFSGCRRESEPTMDKYGHLRVFRDTQGTDQTYEPHCVFGRYRIHFRVVHESRCIEIGYVGRHLPTQRFP